MKNSDERPNRAEDTLFLFLCSNLLFPLFSFSHSLSLFLYLSIYLSLFLLFSLCSYRSVCRLVHAPFNLVEETTFILILYISRVRFARFNLISRLRLIGNPTPPPSRARARARDYSEEQTLASLSRRRPGSEQKHEFESSSAKGRLTRSDGIGTAFGTSQENERSPLTPSVRRRNEPNAGKRIRGGANPAVREKRAQSARS